MKKAIFLIAAIALAFAAFLFLRPQSNRQQASPVAPSQASQTSQTSDEKNPMAMPEPGSNLPSAESATDPEISTHDRAQLIVLENILASHNDNDMRLDTELKVLDAGAKKLFQQKYEQIHAEKRNEKGTAVFLLGRNLTQESDIAFMSKVLAEPPCRSMQNCSSDPPHSTDPDSDNAVEASLAYPQIVALKSLERVLESGRSNPLFRQSLEAVHVAIRSPVAIVANMARSMEAKYN